MQCREISCSPVTVARLHRICTDFPLLSADPRRTTRYMTKECVLWQYMRTDKSMSNLQACRIGGKWASNAGTAFAEEQSALSSGLPAEQAGPQREGDPGDGALSRCFPPRAAQRAPDWLQSRGDGSHMQVDTLLIGGREPLAQRVLDIARKQWLVMRVQQSLRLLC